jgi:hypothetical protein
MKDAALRAFCCFGRLRLGGDIGAITKLLPQKEQARARVILKGIENSSAEDIRRLLLETLQSDQQSMAAYE